MPNRRSVEGEYRVEVSVLDELGLDRQTALGLKLKEAASEDTVVGEAKGQDQDQGQRRRALRLGLGQAEVSDPHGLRVLLNPDDAKRIACDG